MGAGDIARARCRADSNGSRRPFRPVRHPRRLLFRGGREEENRMLSNPPIPDALDEVVAEITSILVQG